MAEEEDLGDYLDRLISSLYVVVERGHGYVSMHPRHSDVVEFIEDADTGRPHPPEDAADHYLIRAFDTARRELLTLPIPSANGFFGERRLPSKRWSDGYVGPGRIVWSRDESGRPTKAHRVDGHHYANEMVGEFGWRCLHGDPDWPCTECGHTAAHHRKYDDGWSYCIGEDEMCNCGDNIGR